MKRLTLALLIFVAWRANAADDPVITYKLGMSRPWTHLFEVEITFDRLAANDTSFDLVLPVWRTGRYVIFDFAGGVERFTAQDGRGNSLAVMKTDKTTWHILSRNAQTVIARYQVYADEFNMRTRGLNDEHGFLDGTSVFMYSPKYRKEPLTLQVVPYENWHVTTGLDPVEGKPFTFTAPGYDYLADCPVEIGTQRDFTFEVEGKPHILSISGLTNCIPESLMAFAGRIVKMNAEFWGSLPYKRYVFLMHAMADAGGGTEHINSTVLDVNESVLRTPDPCHGLVGLFSHEFFHTWNVKQLRPKGMDPYDWTKENYYRELWIAEGTTSYLHNILLVRNGMASASGYIAGLHGQVEGDRQRPGNKEQSVAECSFDAWIKFSRGLPEAYNFETDFYGKGAQVSLLLDLEIRHRTENKSSLDDLMRLMLKRFPLGSGGYTLDDVERLAVEIAGSGMHDFFTRFVRGTAPLEWERTLGYAGLQVQPIGDAPRAWLGIGAGEQGGRTIVRQVVAGSPAYDSGINTGDELIALNGYRVGGNDLPQRIAEMKVGEKVRLTTFRDDKLREYQIELRKFPVPTYSVTKVEKPTKLQREILESWLNAKWGKE